MPWESEFQSTRPRGARHAGADARAGGGRVSIHAPAWGATFVLVKDATGQGVSIHAPAWGATVGATGSMLDELVSIHAPAWGATPRGALLDELGRVSIHAPAWGATCNLGKRDPLSACFNPRARVGRDILLRRKYGRFPVSIHAPAWGATVS